MPREGVLSQALFVTSRGIITLPPLQFLVTSMEPSGTPYSLQSPQTASWESWRKPTKGKNCYQSQLSQMAIRGVWLIQIQLAGQTLVIILSFPGQLLPCCLILCPENLAWQPSGWDPRSMAKICIAPQFVAGVLLTVTTPQENCLSPSSF